MPSLYNCSIQVLDAYIEDLAPRLDIDRHICGVFRANHLINEAIKLYKRKKDLRNWDVDSLPRPGAAHRCMNEYFARDKVHKVYYYD